MIKFVSVTSTIFGFLGLTFGLIAPWGGLIPYPDWMTSNGIMFLVTIGGSSFILMIIGALLLGGGAFAILSSLFLSESERKESSENVITNIVGFISNIMT